jgi:hypothetical protein
MTVDCSLGGRADQVSWPPEQPNHRLRQWLSIQLDSQLGGYVWSRQPVYLPSNCDRRNLKGVPALRRWQDLPPVIHQFG